MFRFKLLFPALAGLAVTAVLAGSCSQVHFQESDALPDIFPDYTEVTVPSSMAGLLSFEMADGREMSYTVKQEGNTLFYSVKAWAKGSSEGTAYAPFKVYISEDAIEPYIAYRLIEPNYEGWKEMGLYSRELASYKEKAIVRNDAVGGGCVNCHTFPGGDPSRMLFHVRGKGGGTVFRNGDSLRILNLATVGLKRQGTYPAWHPSGRYVAFSSNSTQQSFPIRGSQPVEVFDHFSDLMLMDLQTDAITTHPALFNEDEMETFPAWSPDGEVLYYCSAPQLADIGPNRAQIRYALKAIRVQDGAFQGEPWTVFASDSLSVSFPRVYGKWLLFTASAYGTFPIWHQEADLWLMDMESGALRRVDELCSDDTDSYHSWSGNGCWVIFSSRRLDGRYTRLFISHFDGEGHFTKPFLLPQKHPEHNTLRLKSYNIPEFVQGDPGELSPAVSKLFGL